MGSRRQRYVLVSACYTVFAAYTHKGFLAADIKGLTIVDRSPASLKACEAELGPDRVLTVVGDVTEEATAEKYTQATLDKWGRVDIIVLSAGIEGAWHPLHETPMEEFDKVMAVNCRGGEWFKATA